MSFGPEHKSTFAESIERMLEPEPLAYKCCFKEAQGLLTEYDDEDLALHYVHPIYAPIEDEL